MHGYPLFVQMNLLLSCVFQESLVLPSTLSYLCFPNMFLNFHLCICVAPTGDAIVRVKD
jgi:hypothetical protein